MIVQEPYRCLVTGNPVGTDTEMVGHPCECQMCRAVREIDLLKSGERGAVLQARQAAEARAYTRGRVEGYAEGISDAAEEFAQLQTRVVPLIEQLNVMLAMTQRVGEWVKRARKEPT